MSNGWETVGKVAKDDGWETVSPKKPKETEATSGLDLGPQVGTSEAALGAGSRIFGKVAGDVAGIGAIPLHALGAIQTDPGDVKRKVEEATTYEPRTTSGRSQLDILQSKFNPMNWPGMAAGSVAEKVEPGPDAGPWEQALRHGGAEAIRQAPGFLGLREPPILVKGARMIPGSIETGLKTGARDMMTSALKPTLAAKQTGKAAKAVDTLLDAGINVSPGGVEKMQDRISILNDKIKDIVENSTATIDKKQVVSTLQTELDRVTKQVTPQSDMASIAKVWKRFMDHPLLREPKVKRAGEERPAVETTLRKAAAEQPGPAISRTLEQVAGEQPGRATAPPQTPIPQPPPKPIPVKTAQEMKQGTYRALGDKSYGELKGAEIEAQKALARGLKEEIAKAVPAVRPLNAEESQLLNALSVSERRVMMEANKNPLGLGVLTTSPVKLALWLSDRSGLFKSLIARMLNTGSQMAPKIGAMDRAISPVGGFIAGQNAMQIPQPPQ